VERDSDLSPGFDNFTPLATEYIVATGGYVVKIHVGEDSYRRGRGVEFLFSAPD